MPTKQCLFKITNAIFFWSTLKKWNERALKIKKLKIKGKRSLPILSIFIFCSCPAILWSKLPCAYEHTPPPERCGIRKVFQDSKFDDAEKFTSEMHNPCTRSRYLQERTTQKHLQGALVWSRPNTLRRLSQKCFYNSRVLERN